MIDKSLNIKVVVRVNDDGSPYLGSPDLKRPFLKVYNQIDDEQEEILIIASPIGVWVNPKLNLIKIFEGKLFN